MACPYFYGENMLLTKYVDITPNGKNYKHYLKLGYSISTHLDKEGIERMNFHQKITVKTDDLQPGCSAMVTVKCDSCGKEYETHYSAYFKCKHGDKSFCIHCAQRVNKNNTQLKAERRTEEYRNFVKGVLNRDDYTCQCCKRSEILEVHHLDAFNWCVDKRTDINNGITLCAICHRNFHSVYGYGKNTKDQYEHWIDSENANYLRINKDILIKKYSRKKRPEKVYCITTNQLFDNARVAGLYYNMKQPDSVRMCCIGKSKSAGKLEDGTKLKWMYYKDFLETQKTESGETPIGASPIFLLFFCSCNLIF